jgi:predicted DNA-binding transcriptional regulator YafY
VSSLPSPSRILTLLVACLDRGSITVTEAAELLGVPPSRMAETAERLTGFGVPPLGPDDYLDVEVDQGEVRVHQDQGLGTPLRLSTIDGAMLLACLESASASFDGPLRVLRDQTAERLRAAIAPAATKDSGERAKTIAWTDEGGLAEGLVERLHAAIHGRSELKLRYYNRSRDEVQTRRVWPVRIVQHTGRWYLSAWAMPEDAHRIFRLDRVLQAEPTGDGFSLDADLPDLRVDVLFTGSDEKVRVEVRFPTDVALRAARFFRTVQRLRVDEDGVVLALRGPTLPLVVRQLFAFDAPWEVVAPAEARELVQSWCAGLSGA